MNATTGSFYSIQAFNPHEATHPGHKVVCEETLTLIKLLRDQGNQVVVEPDDGRPVEYLFRKGFNELFSDPLVIAFGVGVASSTAAALITGCMKWIWQHRRREHIVKSAPTFTNVVLKNKGDESLFLYTGEPLEPAALDNILSLANRRRNEFKFAAAQRSPFPEMAVPIFLEHTTRLVGWCDLNYRDEGLYSEHCYFFDNIALRKVNRGELRGMSITGIAQESVCSVCRKSYVDCNHVSGVSYDSSLCVNEITRATLINVNLVSKPINEDCYLQMISRISPSV